MFTNTDPVTKEQLARFHACVRTLCLQIYKKSNKNLEQVLKDLILITAVEHGYPVEVKHGIVLLKSLGAVTAVQANVANMSLNNFADQYRPEFGRALYLMNIDKETKTLYKSIGGRTIAEMREEFPEVIQ